MKILIIEDEKLLQEELALQIKAITPANIVHCISTVKESISWLSKNIDDIDLIFMDIELADGISFEIFESVDVNKPIIFLTAYNEYAIQAFKVNSIDYLLKPLNPKELTFAINKYKKTISDSTSFNSELFKTFYIPKNKTQRILIQSGDNFKYVNYSDIAYFKADEKYTTVVTFDNARHLIDDSLNKLELNLPENIFYRPTRQYIVNIDSVTKASKYYNSRLKLYITPQPENEIIISRNKVKEFLSWLGK